MDKVAAANKGKTGKKAPPVGHRFKKGQSGNPNGRPKISEEFRDACRGHGPEALTRLVKIMRSDDDRAASTACSIILDRAYGKPTQQVDVDARMSFSAAFETFLNTLAEGH